MLASSDVVAFVPTTDLGRARRFYAHTLGLTLLSEDAYACVLRAHNALVRVTLVEQLAPAPFTVLGWEVTDIAAAVHELQTRGVEVTRHDGMAQDDLGVWTAPGGSRVAWFKDLDGNTLSLTQV